MLGILLDNRAKINAHGSSIRGLAALVAALRAGHTEVVEYLIMRGADVNVDAGPFKSALHLASWKDNLAIAKSPLKNGAATNARHRLGIGSAPRRSTSPRVKP